MASRRSGRRNAPTSSPRSYAALISSAPSRPWLTSHFGRPTYHTWQVTINNANSSLADALKAIWSTKTPEEALAVLEKNDVRVTNESDKTMQLPKITQLSNEVMAARSAGRGGMDLPKAVILAQFAAQKTQE